MCLILFAYHVHPVYKLIVAANRDEDFQRPTAPVHFWEESHGILAGRDLEKMGTWMGVTKGGRFAALTNFRNPKEIMVGKHSRGELVADALKYDGKLKDYMQDLMKNNHLYPGYNLLAGDGNELFYYSNIEKNLQKLKPGIHGVSNHLLNTEWPKVQIGKEGIANSINEKKEDIVNSLFTLLQNSEQAPDELLPNTGVSLEMERRLSSLFIQNERYGTRSSSVLLMSDEKIEFFERVFSQEQVKENDQKYTIDLKS